MTRINATCELHTTRPKLSKILPDSINAYRFRVVSYSMLYSMKHQI